MRVFRGLWRRIGLTLFAVGLLLSPAFYDTLKLMQLAADDQIAEVRLSLMPPETYAAELGAALDANDGDLARSILALATDRGVAVPEALAARVAALPGFDLGHVAGQGWNCVVNGDFDSEAGFACVLATDLTSIGDVRDLVGEGGNYITGQPVNYLTLGLSSVGLTLTAATIGTGGGMLPLRAGASFLKAVNKAGKVPPRLAAEIGTLLQRSVNPRALDEAVDAARGMRLGDVGAPLSRLFDRKGVAAVTDLATDIGRIGGAGGVRAMKMSVEVADSSRDLKVLARTAEKYQDRFPAVMKMLGKGAVRLADLIWHFAGWVIAALGWLLSMAWFMLRATTGTARFAGRMLVRRTGAA